MNIELSTESDSSPLTGEVVQGWQNRNFMPYGYFLPLPPGEEDISKTYCLSQQYRE